MQMVKDDLKFNVLVLASISQCGTSCGHSGHVFSGNQWLWDNQGIPVNTAVWEINIHGYTNGKVFRKRRK